LAPLPDGRLASGEEGGAVRLWDAVRGGEASAVIPIGGGEGKVRALAVLPDGRLAVGVSDISGKLGGIAIWDMGATPPARRAVVDGRCGVYALAVLADGRLAVGGHDGCVRLDDDLEVDGGEGAVIDTLRGHTLAVKALAVLPDGTLASGSWDTSVRLWDVDAQMCVATLAGHTDCVCALAVLTDGRLASGSGDYTVRLWSVATRACVGVLEEHTGYVLALTALPDGRLASGAADKTIRVWDTRPAAGVLGMMKRAWRRGTPVVVMEGHTHDVVALAPLPGGRLASGSVDKTVRLCRLPR